MATLSTKCVRTVCSQLLSSLERVVIILYNKADEANSLATSCCSMSLILSTVADTSRNIGRDEIFNMYAFGVHLRYANLSNIMLGISNSLFDILL